VSAGPGSSGSSLGTSRMSSLSNFSMKTVTVLFSFTVDFIFKQRMYCGPCDHLAIFLEYPITHGLANAMG